MVVVNAGVWVNQSTTVHIDAPFLDNKAAFSYEIAGNQWQSDPSAWIDQWFFDQDPPFKYRVLGKVPIYVTYQALQQANITHLDAFYYAYLAWVLIFLGLFLFVAGRFVAAYVALLKGDFEHQQRYHFIVAVSMLSLLPPVLHAFKFPVHGSPNDFLGYFLVAASLMALLRHHYRWFVLCSLLGILCRETNALVLLPFLLMSNIAWVKRLGFVVIMVLLTLLYRMSWGESYDPMYAAAHNGKFPYESMMFVFLVFGPLWVLSFIGFYRAHYGINALSQPAEPLVQAIKHSFLIAILSVLVVLFMFARLREIRLEYILWFYILPYSMFSFYEGAVAIKHWKKLPIVSVFLLFSGLITLIAANKLMPITEAEHIFLMNTFASFYGGFGGGWRTIFLVHCFLTCAICMIAAYFGVVSLHNRRARLN